MENAKELTEITKIITKLGGGDIQKMLGILEVIKYVILLDMSNKIKK